MNPVQRSSIGNLKIVDFNISNRLKIVLEKNNVVYFSELIEMMNMKKLKTLKGVHKKSAAEITLFFSSFYYKSIKFYSLYDELRRAARKCEVTINFDSESFAKAVIPSCNSRFTDEKVFEKVKFVATEKFFKDKITIEDKFILDFIQEEKDRAALREKFGIPRKLYFKVHRI